MIGLLMHPMDENVNIAAAAATARVKISIITSAGVG
jgi:hypothetical protein